MGTPKPPATAAPIHFIPTFWKIIIILLSGLALSAVITFSLNSKYFDILQERADTLGFSVSADDVRQLKDYSKPDSAVPYDQVKRRLAQLKPVYGDTRFLYIMDKKASGEIVFLADSEPKDSADYSPRNQVYNSPTPALQAAFENKKSFVEGPVSDDYGSWYSALAPIYDENGAFIALVGMDVSVTNYADIIFGTGSVPFSISVIAAIAVYVFDRSRRRRLDALRFQIDLMALTSHELQSPIRGIRWGQETLMKTSLDESQRKLLQTMLEGTVQLENSVENILQLDSLQLTTPPSDMTNIDLSSVVQDVATSNILAARQRNIQITFTPPWPSTIITRGETASLRRCLNSILSSELRNTKEGGELRVSYETRDTNHVIVLTSSTINLSRDELDYIFDYSHQTKKLAKNKVAGAGMGLFMARTVIEQFDGRIAVSQAENSNEVKVTIEFPISPSAR